MLLLWIICKWAYQDWFDDGFKYGAKAASLSATTLMCWCVVLSARFRVVEDLFGGLDKVYQIHKRLGKALCVVIALHPSSSPRTGCLTSRPSFPTSCRN